MTYEEAEDYAKEKGLYGFIEASAKSGENVNEVFSNISELLYEKYEAG